MFAFSIDSAENAVIEIGTSCSDSSRLRAVTVTSSRVAAGSAPESWATATEARLETPSAVATASATAERRTGIDDIDLKLLERWMTGAGP